jgi:uncharacterized membrane protein YdjX (TVP38/TMEM64 family)
MGVALWIWAAGPPIDLHDLAARLEPYRHEWYALPLVMLAFTCLGLALVPMLFLVAVTGFVFGPWLGPIYALAGCLASASAGFGIGRWMGHHRIQELGGERLERLMVKLKRNGTLAVFLIRKIPAPFAVTNIVVGASTVRYRDFFFGTLLGTGAGAVALAGFSYHLAASWRHPSPATLVLGALYFLVPLTLAWLLNAELRRKAAA